MVLLSSAILVRYIKVYPEHVRKYTGEFFIIVVFPVLSQLLLSHLAADICNLSFHLAYASYDVIETLSLFQDYALNAKIDLISWSFP